MSWLDWWFASAELMVSVNLPEVTKCHHLFVTSAMTIMMISDCVGALGECFTEEE